MKNLYVLTLVGLLSGCSSVKDETGKFGAADLFTQPIETIDILSIISGGQESNEEDSTELSVKEFSQKFDTALRKYNPKTKLARNRIQDRIILASNVLCEDYKIVLKRKQSRSNFWLGTAATTFGAAGAVANGARAAKNFAALSGLSSGARAEYNQSYFSDLGAQVITKGINARRAEILGRIAVARDKKLLNYTVEAAIADAVIYHGGCSLISGLEQADTAITKLSDQNNIGLDALNANSSYIEKIQANKVN